MKKTQYYKGGAYSKLTASLLVFLFILAPLTSLGAQEAIPIPGQTQNAYSNPDTPVPGQGIPNTNTSTTTTTTVYPSKYYNTDGTTATKHIFSNDVEVGTVTGTGAEAVPRYIHTDNLTGANIITNSAGTIEETLDYFPFGGIRIDSGSYSDQRKYIGQEYDADTGLNYLNARYYNSKSGQFLSQDPVFWEIGQTEDGKKVLSNPQAQNSYSYAGNNPIINKDSNGRAFIVDDAIGFIGGGLVASFIQTGVSLVTTKQLPTPAEVSGAFVTGGIIGWGAVNTPETFGASNAVSAAILTGTIGGFYGNLTKQGIDMKTGQQTGGINYKELHTNTLITAGAGGLFEGVLPNAKISGLSSGRGNMNAIGKAMQTKMATGTISKMSVNTAVKSAVGSQASSVYRTVAGGVVDFVRSVYNKFNKK